MRRTSFIGARSDLSGVKIAIGRCSDQHRVGFREGRGRRDAIPKSTSPLTANRRVASEYIMEGCRRRWTNVGASGAANLMSNADVC